MQTGWIRMWSRDDALFNVRLLYKSSMQLSHVARSESVIELIKKKHAAIALNIILARMKILPRPDAGGGNQWKASIKQQYVDVRISNDILAYFVICFLSLATCFSATESSRMQICLLCGDLLVPFPTRTCYKLNASISIGSYSVFQAHNYNCSLAWLRQIL